MSSNPADADLKRAREEGRKAGSVEARSAVDCPYGHGTLPLRTAWLEGFGQGRVAAEPLPSRGRNREAGPEPHTS